MDITYMGHSCFKLRGKSGVLVTDPFSPSVGFPLPNVSADVVTVSHHHADHDAVERVTGTTRRTRPFVIDRPGEYEVQEISVFALPSFHDTQSGAQRGKNTIMVIHLDGICVVHLGDLGHLLSDRLLSDLGVVHVLLAPIGGEFTVGPKQAAELVEAIEPAYVVPMHYRTERHAKEFAQIQPVDAFLKELGKESTEPQDKLAVSVGNLPLEMEVVVLKQ